MWYIYNAVNCTCFQRLIPTYNSEIHPGGPCLAHLEVDPAPVQSVLTLTDVEHLEPGLVWAGAGVEHHPVVAEQLRIDPVAPDVVDRGDVDPGPGVDGVDGALHVLSVPHDQGEFVAGTVPGHGDIAR